MMIEEINTSNIVVRELKLFFSKINCDFFTDLLVDINYYCIFAIITNS